MANYHINGLIITSRDGKYYGRGQRQFIEDEVEKTAGELLSEYSIDIASIESGSNSAVTYSKNRILSNGEVE